MSRATACRSRTSSHTWLLHEGFVGVADGSLKDATYSDFKDDKPPQTFTSTGGWVGITDKYWMAAVIPPQNAAFDGAYRAAPGGSEHAKPSGRLPPAAGDHRAGQDRQPDPASVRRRQGRARRSTPMKTSCGITRFDLAVDWGWFWFFTKPIFWLLDTFYHCDRQFRHRHPAADGHHQAAFFPLANASFKSMSKMKKLQPEMNTHQGTLRRRQGAPAAGDDGALQAREGQPGLGLPADADPDAGVLLALQGALRHHRDAARAVLGWIHDLSRARSDLDPQPVRASALSHPGSSSRPSCPSASGRC